MIRESKLVFDWVGWSKRVIRRGHFGSLFWGYFIKRKQGMGHPCTWGIGQTWRIQNRCLWKCLADYTTCTIYFCWQPKKKKAYSVGNRFKCSKLSQTTMHVDAAGSEFPAFTFARAVKRFLFCPFYSLLRQLQLFYLFWVVIS